jgi:hypothetical protein
MPSTVSLLLGAALLRHFANLHVLKVKTNDGRVHAYTNINEEHARGVPGFKEE